MFSIPSRRNLSASNQILNTAFLDGTIYAVKETATDIYVGGDFTIATTLSSYNASYGAVVNSVNAAFGRDLSCNGTIRCSAIYGNYIYFGGDFTTCQGIACQRIVKVSLITGLVDTTFNSASGFDSGVYSIALDSSGNLYAGGSFTFYKGVARQRIAKINATTATLDTTFDSAIGFDSTVFSTVLDSSGNLYACGAFTAYKSVARQRIAKINTTTAALDTTFDSATGFTSMVRAIVLDSSGNLYVGGDFTAYKSVTRQYIVKINTTTAALDTTFDSATGFNGSVYSIVLDSSGNLYVGGGFSLYKSVTRQRIVKISATTAALDTTFDSANGFSSTVNFIALDSFGNLYAGGFFNAYKSVTRQYIVKINTTTAALDTTFDSATGFNSGVNSIALDSFNNLYIGGQFTAYKQSAVWARNIAKISKASGYLDTNFNTGTGTNGPVLSIALDSSNKLYIGGSFNFYNGVSRLFIAKIDSSTAALDTTFDTASGFDSNINSMVLDSSNNLYVGGVFTTYKGTTRQRIAKLNATTAALDTAFDSTTGFNNTVWSIALDSSGNLYAGGSFTFYKGVARQRIAKINTTTAALDTTFDSATGFDAGSAVRSIVLDSSNKLYVGGDFTAYKSVARQRIAKLDATTAALDTTFDSATGFNTTVVSIVPDSFGNLYACGAFTAYKSVTRQCIAKLNATTAALDTAFDSTTGFNNTVWSIALDSSGNLYAGGSFTFYKGVTRQRIAALNKDTGSLLP